jgi:CheY-like chemotaxis protein
MTAILGFSDVLTSELEGKVADHYHTFLRSINISGRRLLTLLNDILDLSKIEAGRVDVDDSEIDVGAEVESYIAPLVWIAKQKSLSMNIELYPDRLIIAGDRHRLGQVVTNIVSNAIKFTRSGSITVRTSLRDVQGDSKTKQAAIEVEDTGIGIGKDFLPNLFEEFRQEHTGNTKEYGGTGLGLAISKRLVTKMGGSIEVHSNEGAGSTFTILFPLVAVGRAPVVVKKENEDDHILNGEFRQSKPSSVPPPTPDILKKHVLVVEDNLETQNLVDAYLRESFRLSYAANASDVLLALEQDSPDIILMDINLPGRDGLSITRDIRSGNISPNVPIIALTALAMAGDRQRCLGAGCNDYLSKPATRREVLEAITKALNGVEKTSDES